MQVVILAGGLGTRMRPLTEAVPKALLPVAGEPFAHHQLTWLAGNRVAKVVYSIGYRGDLVRSYVGDGSRWGLSISYVDEGDDLKGTAGALRLAYDAGELDERFGVLYGDSYVPIALEPVWRAFGARGLPALMTVLRNDDRWEPSNVVYEDGLVTLYEKRRTDVRVGEMRWIDAGLSVVSRGVVADRIPPGRVVDLADVYRELSGDGLLGGLELKERFYEVGSPNGLDDLERHLRSRDHR